MVFFRLRQSIRQSPSLSLDQQVVDLLSRVSISGRLRQWFQSYLSNRSQRVALQGTYSKWLHINFGVPWGSLLGPLLFLAYIDDIPQCIQHDSNIAISADDSRSFRSLLIRSLFSKTWLSSPLNWNHLSKLSGPGRSGGEARRSWELYFSTSPLERPGELAPRLYTWVMSLSC